MKRITIIVIVAFQINFMLSSDRDQQERKKAYAGARQNQEDDCAVVRDTSDGTRGVLFEAAVIKGQMLGTVERNKAAQKTPEDAAREGILVRETAHHASLPKLLDQHEKDTVVAKAQETNDLGKKIKQAIKETPLERAQKIEEQTQHKYDDLRVELGAESLVRDELNEQRKKDAALEGKLSVIRNEAAEQHALRQLSRQEIEDKQRQKEQLVKDLKDQHPIERAKYRYKRPTLSDQLEYSVQDGVAGGIQGGIQIATQNAVLAAIFGVATYAWWYIKYPFVSSQTREIMCKQARLDKDQQKLKDALRVEETRIANAAQTMKLQQLKKAAYMAEQEKENKLLDEFIEAGRNAALQHPVNVFDEFLSLEPYVQLEQERKRAQEQLDLLEQSIEAGRKAAQENPINIFEGVVLDVPTQAEKAGTHN